MEQTEAQARMARELLATLGKIRVVVCVRCNGLGELRHALNLTCPVCFGSGETTERTEHEHTRER